MDFDGDGDEWRPDDDGRPGSIAGLSGTSSALPRSNFRIGPRAQALLLAKGALLGTPTTGSTYSLDEAIRLDPAQHTTRA